MKFRVVRLKVDLLNIWNMWDWLSWYGFIVECYNPLCRGVEIARFPSDIHWTIVPGHFSIYPFLGNLRYFLYDPLRYLLIWPIYLPNWSCIIRILQIRQAESNFLRLLDMIAISTALWDVSLIFYWLFGCWLLKSILLICCPVRSIYPCSLARLLAHFDSTANVLTHRLMKPFWLMIFLRDEEREKGRFEKGLKISYIQRLSLETLQLQQNNQTTSSRESTRTKRSSKQKGYYSVG